MDKEFVCQGRSVTPSDVAWLRQWIADRPDFSRKGLAKALCREWNWTNAAGVMKDFAARSFLNKLESRGLIALPHVQKKFRSNPWSGSLQQQLALSPPTDQPMTTPLHHLSPLEVLLCSRRPEKGRFRSYLATHHYLGFDRTVGENLSYLIRDQQGRDLACLLFGSAAWKAKPRDSFIGWEDDVRRKNLNFITNNTRFLILPWVKVPHLASHILAAILRRLSSDWQKKYGHPIHLVETFVERDRFKGTCYKAANWIRVGETQGRSRQDRDNTMVVPVKEIYLYPLHCRFREDLCRS